MSTTVHRRADIDRAAVQKLKLRLASGEVVKLKCCCKRIPANVKHASNFVEFMQRRRALQLQTLLPSVAHTSVAEFEEVDVDELLRLASSARESSSQVSSQLVPAKTKAVIVAPTVVVDRDEFEFDADDETVVAHSSGHAAAASVDVQLKHLKFEANLAPKAVTEVEMLVADQQGDALSRDVADFNVELVEDVVMQEVQPQNRVPEVKQVRKSVFEIMHGHEEGMQELRAEIQQIIAQCEQCMSK